MKSSECEFLEQHAQTTNKHDQKQNNGAEVPATDHFPAPQEEPAEASLPLTDSGPGQRLIVTLLVLKTLLRHHQRHFVQVGGLIFQRVSVKSRRSNINKTQTGNRNSLIMVSHLKSLNN